MKQISEYMPYESIACNLLVNQDYEEYPFLGGTGFFVQFQPYDYIFYITAKHCFTESNNTETEIIEKLRLSYKGNNTKPTDDSILFSEMLFGQDENDDEYEDILVFVVDNNVNQENIELLKKRTLTLHNQSVIDKLLQDLCKNKKEIGTIGFPGISKSLSYDTKRLTGEIRGYSGVIKDNSIFKNRYGFEEASWKEKKYNGFSGSPVLVLAKHENESELKATLIGILLTATSHRGEFLSINFATDLIANYIKANKTLERNR